MKILPGLIVLGLIVWAVTRPSAPREVPEVCKAEPGATACEHLGADNVREVTLENGFLRIVYKWEVLIGNETERNMEEREMVATFCGVRDQVKAERYRIEALIGVVDASGNQSEERGVVVTLDDATLAGLNCDNQLYVDLEVVGDYVLHRLLP